MSGYSARRLDNFSDLILSLKNELNHHIPASNQLEEDTDDILPPKRYTIQAGDICLVLANNGIGKSYVCGFVTECYIGTDEDDDKEARVVFDNNTVLHFLDFIMIFRIDVHGVVQPISERWTEQSSLDVIPGELVRGSWSTGTSRKTEYQIVNDFLRRHLC